MPSQRSIHSCPNRCPHLRETSRWGPLEDQPSRQMGHETVSVDWVAGMSGGSVDVFWRFLLGDCEEDACGEVDIDGVL